MLTLTTDFILFHASITQDNTARLWTQDIEKVKLNNKLFVSFQTGNLIESEYVFRAQYHINICIKG